MTFDVTSHATFDLIATVILTASAAICIATLAIGFAGSVEQRIRLATILTAWFSIVVLFAALRLFSADRGPLASAGFGLSILVPTIALTLIVARNAKLRRRLSDIALPALIGMHAVRVLGVLFLVLHAQNRLPAEFANMAGWGDILVGLTALPVAWLVARNHPWSRSIALLWNVAGLADLLDAIFLGLTSAPGPARLIFGEVSSVIMASLPWFLIPGFLVPVLLVSHFGIVWRLLRPNRGEADVDRAGPRTTVMV
ncbi:hypothetical protein [Bradyrhizobium prioriisuperbiae]|uniref:hypothetical protein n=1 Tax=Bradyrhizobium prioriisuperbiae TaxID=2854389 RepID=UPI0028E83EAA|nr:hypothetical protein [Bradyrhizobium prioritasuperba]